MLEEQAMSRVHRIGQTRPVTLVRFVVRNPFEENIVKVQERKRTLADLVVNGARLKDGDAGTWQLQVVFPYPGTIIRFDSWLIPLMQNLRELVD